MSSGSVWGKRYARRLSRRGYAESLARIRVGYNKNVIGMTDIVIESRFRQASVEQIGERLQFFPLVHQVADLPHQGLVPVDDGLGRARSS